MKIKIKGKEYGLHWGLGAIECASEVYKIDGNLLFLHAIDRDDEYNDDGEIIKLGAERDINKEIVLGAILNWCEENEVKVDFSVKNFTNAYNDFDQETRDELKRLFKKSIQNGKVVEDIYNDIIAKLEASAKGSGTKKKGRTTNK